MPRTPPATRSAIRPAIATTVGRRRLAAVVGLIAAGALLGAGPARAEGKPAPEYSARPLGSDEPVSLEDLRGNVVLLNTWATWCEPCREEMPAFERIYQRHRGDGLRIVAVNVDQGRADGKVSRYVDAAGYTFSIWRDPSNRMAKRFRVLGPPETFLLGRDGRIRFHWRGQMDPDAPANRSRILAALGLEQAQAAAAASAVAGIGLLVAFGAGLVSVLSPCMLPLIPSYASVIAGVSLRRSRAALGATAQPATRAGAGGVEVEAPPASVPSRATAMLAGVSFVAGFSAVFIALGVLFNRAGAALADNRIWLTRGGGVVLVALGLHLLGVLRVPGADREVRFFKLSGQGGKLSGKGGYAGPFVVGVAFAAGWSPCVGPVLAGILTLAAAGGSALDAAILLGAYCAGLAVPFLGAAFALDRFLAWSARLRRSWLPVAERVSGALVVLVGVLLLTGVFSRLADWVT